MNKTNKNPNVPNLRFTNNSHWKSSLLENVCQFYKGNGISKSNLTDSGHKCILYGQLYTIYLNEIITNVESKTNIKLKNPFYSKKNDLIIPSSGEDPLDIAVARSVQVDDVLLGSDLNVLRPNKSINSSFLSYQLNGKRKLNIAKIAQGKSIVHLHNEDLKKIKVYFPDINEQNRIASLLSKIDDRIETQSKIIEAYSSLINSIRDSFFVQTDNKMIKLSNYVNIYNGYAFKSNSYVNKGKFKIITIGNVTGNKFVNLDIVNTIDQFPNDIQSHQVLNKGDILISLTGNVGRVSICNENNCLLNQRVALITPKNIVKNYIYHMLSSTLFINSMVSKSQGAAQKNISIHDILDYQIPFKSDEEIKNIIKILDMIDCKIEDEKRMLSLLQSQKDYLLKNMFV